MRWSPRCPQAPVRLIYQRKSSKDLRLRQKPQVSSKRATMLVPHLAAWRGVRVVCWLRFGTGAAQPVLPAQPMALNTISHPSHHSSGSGVFPALVFVQGSEQKNIVLNRTPFTVGRKVDKDLVIADPRVSRDHAQIMQLGLEFFIEDLGSKHGTFVNGERIRLMFYSIPPIKPRIPRGNSSARSR
jgi:hypothetical protein